MHGGRRKKRGKKGKGGVKSVGVRSNTHGGNEICAQTSSRRNVNPIFPGITSGPAGVGWGRVRDGYTREGAHFSTKDLFFHFSWRR